MKTIPLAEAKAKLSELIDTVARRDERVTITKRGRPAAVLMSHEDAAGLEATLEIMSDPEFYAEILRNAAALDRGEGIAMSLDELFGEEVASAHARASRGTPSRSDRGRPAPRAGVKTKSSRGAGGTRRRSGPR
jgi:prevent-host-death family protein